MNAYKDLDIYKVAFALAKRVHIASNNLHPATCTQHHAPSTFIEPTPGPSEEGNL
jgi:hypothetical protein